MTSYPNAKIELLQEAQQRSEEETRRLIALARLKLKELQAKELVDFPLTIFPDKLRAMIESYNNAFGLPSDYFGLSILTISGAVIGNSMAAVDRGQYHAPMIFGVLVGSASIGKTPAIKICLAPVIEIERRLEQAYEEEKAEYDRMEREEGVDESEQAPPNRKELLLNDVTTEAVVRVMRRNRRGLLLFRDEVAAWLNSMNAYRGRGGDKNFYMETWSSSPSKINRSGQDNAPIMLYYPFCSVVGSIQPAILQRLADGNSDLDGFLARLLFAFPENTEKPRYQRLLPDPALSDHWAGIINMLWAIPCRVGDYEAEDFRPIAIQTGYKAGQLYEQWFNENAAAIDATDDEVVKAILGKFDSYVLRMALIIEMLHWAEGEILAPTNPFGEDGWEIEDFDGLQISDQSMEKAILACNYFKLCALKVRNRLGSPIDALPDDRRAWYDVLPEEFDTQTAQTLAKEFNISERTVRRLLNNEMTSREIFKKMSRGWYGKLYS